MITSTTEMYVLVSKDNRFLVRKGRGYTIEGMSPYCLTLPCLFAENSVVMAWRRRMLVNIKKEWNDFVRKRSRSAEVRKATLVQIKKIEVCLKEAK